jgi:ubiquinone/menaquinone biosynthesis C-methylase UbiE
MPAPASPERIKDVNERYHDVAAESYDSKWGIDFGEVGQDQVLAKMRKALAGWTLGQRFSDALEIGAGTGYFTLNLMQAGVIERATATDISPGMLKTLKANAKRLGLKVETKAADAERLPFEDAGFDLVFGHAVLHHIPDLERAFDEFHRVLRPGGVLVFCGEPSRYGDLIAAVPKRAALMAGPVWRRAIGADRRDYSADEADVNGHALEREVDVHAFSPGDLAGFARAAGFADVHVGGEELLANMHGWTMRTLEAGAEPDQIPWGWRTFAFRSYMALQKVDSRVLEPHLPAQLFYNLLISARKP